MRVTRAFLTGVVLLLPVVAAADKGGKGHGHGHGGDEVAPERSGSPAELTVVFGAREREAARSFFADAHGRGNCPPGLAKKHNGCLPPGQAKKRYVVGHALARGVVYDPAPAELARRLGPAPHGYLYVMVDGDLLKLAAGTLLVVDAIHGLVD